MMPTEEGENIHVCLPFHLKLPFRTKIKSTNSWFLTFFCVIYLGWQSVSWLISCYNNLIISYQNHHIYSNNKATTINMFVSYRVQVAFLSDVCYIVFTLSIRTHEFLNPSLAEHGMPCLNKQCRSRSVGFWRSQLIWICTVCHYIYEFLSKTWIQ